MLKFLQCWFGGHRWKESSVNVVKRPRPSMDFSLHPPKPQKNKIAWGIPTHLNWRKEIKTTTIQCERCLKNKTKYEFIPGDPVKYVQWHQMHIPAGLIVLPAGYLLSKCGLVYGPTREIKD